MRKNNRIGNRNRQRYEIRRRDCLFCKSKSKPDFRDPETLKKFVSSRARILGRLKTGVCAKHQKQLSKAIKRARHLALMPFVS